MDISVLFYSKDVVKSVIEYLGFVETIYEKVEKLGQAKLDSGIKALEQAKKAPKEEVPWLIREARSKFNEAISIEKNERLGIAYLGLALCFSYLEDEANCIDALEQILNIPSTVEQMSDNNPKKNLAILAQSSALFKTYADMFKIKSYESFNFEVLREKLRETLKKYINEYD